MVLSRLVFEVFNGMFHHCPTQNPTLYRSITFFSYISGKLYFFILKLGTILPSNVVHPSLDHIFVKMSYKNEQDRFKLSFYILVCRTLYLLNVIIISNLTGKRITKLSESSKRNTCYL